MGEKLVDVEDLLVWAADELSRKRPKPGRGAPALDIPRRDRECVGKYHWPRGYPTVSPMFAAGLGSASVARGEPPHADALTIEAAIGELRGFHLRAPAEADLRAGLGFDLDAPGAWAAAAGNVGNLLLVHARQGDRPSLGATLPAPVLAANGKPGTWRAEEWDEPTYDDHARASRVVEVACRAIRKDLYPPGAFCRLAWSPSPQSILNERGEYAAWRAGLEWLLERLRGALETRTPLPAAAAWRPWLGERDGDKPRDLFGPQEAAVYDADYAEAMAAGRAAGLRRPRGGGTIYRGRAVKPAGEKSRA